MAKSIMIQGTMSNVGKSLLCAALCRVLHQDGYRCAPFKSQNMALNSGVTRDGLEMGRAQILQAQAAGIEPDVRMNPILLKPTSDHRSQVIINGEALGEFSAREYFAMKKQLLPGVLEAYHSLAEENDIIVIEGAGSPAEINLKQDDIVNMGLAELVDAPVLLAGDIDPGGVFAQLYGTVKLLEEKEQKRIRGLIINKFRGDVSLLEPGLKMMEEKLGIPVIGVLEYLPLELDAEDSMSSDLKRHSHDKPLDIAVIRFPRISNFTDLDPLCTHPMLGVRYVHGTSEFGEPDMVILPGTKSTLADLRWMKESGLADRITESAEKGTCILGICGGYQMLGETLADPCRAEDDGMTCKAPGIVKGEGVACGAKDCVPGSDAEFTETGLMEARLAETGLGLLPIKTVFHKNKTLRLVRGTIREGFLSGATVYGYEIHTGETILCKYAGQTEREPGHVRSKNIELNWNGLSTGVIQSSGGQKLVGAGVIPVCARDNVCGTYLHGLFDSGEAVDLLAKTLSRKRGLPEPSYVSMDRKLYRQQQLDRLADAFRSHMDMERIYRILENSGRYQMS